MNRESGGCRCELGNVPVPEERRFEHIANAQNSGRTACKDGIRGS